MRLVENDDSGADATYGVEVFYRGEMVNSSRSDVGDAWWMDGEAAARAHGYMMLHAAGLASR